MIQETLSTEPMGTFKLRHCRFRMNENEDWLEIDSVYNKNGDYIGNLDTARLLQDKGIEPEVAQDDHNNCSIGFCESQQKWYGWSHRAMFGFGIGYVSKEGECQVTSGWVDDIDPRTGELDTLPIPIGFQTETLDDCKRVAIAFAASVS